MTVRPGALVHVSVETDAGLFLVIPPPHLTGKICFQLAAKCYEMDLDGNGIAKKVEKHAATAIVSSSVFFFTLHIRQIALFIVYD